MYKVCQDDGTGYCERDSPSWSTERTELGRRTQMRTGCEGTVRKAAAGRVVGMSSCRGRTSPFGRTRWVHRGSAHRPPFVPTGRYATSLPGRRCLPRHRRGDEPPFAFGSSVKVCRMDWLCPSNVGVVYDRVDGQQRFDPLRRPSLESTPSRGLVVIRDIRHVLGLDHKNPARNECRAT